MPESLVCPQCGQGFKVKPSHINIRRFCSNACYDASGERARNGRNNGMKGKAPYEVHPRGMSGKHHSLETRQRMSEGRKGRVFSEKTRRLLSISAKSHPNPMLGKHQSEEARQKISEALKILCQDPEFLKERMRGLNIKPNKAELLLDSWIKELSPGEWKYVGAGDFILGGKNPDWLNINGHKALIELFGEPWHPEADEPETIEHFAQFGFKTLVIWYKELKNKELVLKKIRSFVTTVG